MSFTAANRKSIVEYARWRLILAQVEKERKALIAQCLFPLERNKSKLLLVRCDPFGHLSNSDFPSADQKEKKSSLQQFLLLVQSHIPLANFQLFGALKGNKNYHPRIW